MFKPSIAVLLATSLAACTTLRTVDAPEGRAKPARPLAGLHYFLPRAVVTITGAPGTADGDYAVTVTTTMAADKTARYRLVPTTNWLYDDSANFSVDESGLINGAVTNSSVPRLADIIQTLGDSAILVGKIILKLQALNTVTAAAAPERIKLDRFSVSFDPFDPTDKRAAIAKMQAAGLTLEVLNSKEDPSKTAYPSSTRVPGQRYFETSNPRPFENWIEHQGIVYRPLTTVKLRVSAHSDRKENVAHTFIASVPDPNSVATYSLGRSFLANKKNIPTFVNGVLKQIDYSYESEALAGARLVKSVAQQAFGVINDAPDVVGLIYKPKPPVDPNADLNREIRRLDAEKTRIELQNEILRKKKENDALKNTDAGSASAPNNNNNQPLGFTNRSIQTSPPNAPTARQRPDDFGNIPLPSDSDPLKSDG